MSFLLLSPPFRYSPALQLVLDDPSRIPPEITLFFHNKAWEDLVVPYVPPPPTTHTTATTEHMDSNDISSGTTTTTSGSSNGNHPHSHPPRTMVPLFQRIRDRHAGALVELGGMAAAWDALGPVWPKGDEARFHGVQARFREQVADAAMFRKTIMGYYENISGLTF